MMGRRFDRAMGRPRHAVCRQSAVTGLGLLSTALLSLGLLGPAPMRGAEKEVPYPSTDLFRRLQLDVLDCGRENAAASCDAARKVADPLMDHPRLPASCKDLLWTIREKAVVAPTNSFNRRELLNRAAADVMPVCRERNLVKPVAKPEEQKGPTLKF